MNSDLLLHLIMVFNIQMGAMLETECPSRCECYGTKLKCFTSIPDFIPPYVREVAVYEVLLEERFNFSSPGWQNITSLSINPGQSVFFSGQQRYRTLFSREFNNLRSLEYLQIASKDLGEIQENTFLGLNRLRVLDLSNNDVLEIKWIVDGLTGDNILPNLTELYLANTSVKSYSTFSMDTRFFNAVRNKPLKVLDISKTENAWFQWSSALLTAFPFLEKLNISETGLASISLSPVVQRLYHYPWTTTFSKLKVIDISYPSVPFQLSDTGFKLKLTGDVFFTSFLNVTEVYAKRLFAATTNVTGFSDAKQMCVWILPRARNIKFCYVGRPGIITKVVISDNYLINLEPDMWRGFTVLRYLDFSRNKLGNVFSESEFGKSTMDILYKLEVLLLSDNGIFTIPKDVFRNSKYLKLLDLSSNNLEAITFKTKHLKSIKQLDLSNNKIAFLDDESMYRMDNLFYISSSNTSSGIGSVNFLIIANPFVCSCKAVRFLKWLLSFNTTYTCMLNSAVTVINKLSVQRSEYLCKQTFVVVTFIVLAVLEILLLAVMFYLVFQDGQRILLKRKLNRGIQIYTNNEMDQKAPPVFLSFSSDDDEMVMNDILPNMDASLKKLLKTESRCVATGVMDFRPGFSVANEIIRCIENSSVVIFFVTKSFCEKMWCRNETLVAYNNNKPTVLILGEQVDRELMPKHLQKSYQQYVRVHLMLKDGQRVMMPGMDELCESVVRQFSEADALNM